MAETRQRQRVPKRDNETREFRRRRALVRAASPTSTYRGARSAPGAKPLALDALARKRRGAWEMQARKDGVQQPDAWPIEEDAEGR
jgi:hypothetical protein